VIDFCKQISTNLRNTLHTFGASSHQYKAVLQTLRECIREIEDSAAAARYGGPKKNPDPDMLSQAMAFLQLEE
jgi:hypothetical protein